MAFPIASVCGALRGERRAIEMVLLTLILAVITAALSSAQAPLTLAEAIREAQSAHPLLRAAEARVVAAQSLQLQAAARPNPRFTVQTENLRAWGQPGFSFPNDTDNFVTLSQVFETGGKRSARVDAADTGVRSAESELALIGRQIAARVSLAYWSAAAATALQSLLRQDIENFDKIVQYHRDRVREGAMAEVDLMRILLERDRLTVALRAAEQESSRSIISLLREMGRSGFATVPLADAITGVRELAPPRIEEILPARPELTSARRAVDQARAAVRLQQSLARPDTEVMGGYKRATGFDTFVASIGIDLPFRNRNQGAIGSAQASVRAAEAQVAAVENQIRAEVALAWADYDARRRVVTEVLTPMRQRADDVARIAQAAYREGGVDLLRLLDAERARIDSLTMYFRGLADYQQSATTLQIVTGAPL